tara:strand:+ start:887 stop:1159 length:273 start_codon:yes stop_codon:yes gene_type:complete
MDWNGIDITDKIFYLKDLMGNSNQSTFDDSQNQIVDTLITGSKNTYSGDVGFTIKPHHLKYMNTLWDKAIINQVDDSIMNKIKKSLNKIK